MATTLQVTFDAADPAALAAFWGELIGYVEQDPPEGFDSWEAWAVANDVPREHWATTTPGSTPTAPARGSTSSGCPSPRRPRTGCTWTWP